MIRSQGEDGDYSPPGDPLDPCADRILAHIGGKSVPDLGCGHGRYARKLADRGADVSGIDPVLELIVEAKRRCPAGVFTVSAAEDLPFDSRCTPIGRR